MNSQGINLIFERKKAYHKSRANDTFEQKLVYLVELQKLGLEMKRASNRPIKSYEIVWKIE